MKTCSYCGRENEDQATTCQECGTEFTLNPAPSQGTPREPGDWERFEKIAVLDSEVQAELMDDILSGRDIPHIMQSYHDSALDGLYQAGKGWGVILAPAAFKEEILAALEDVKRQSESAGSAEEASN
jgi:hypothetical protein